MPGGTRVLTRADVLRLLPMGDCIAAVEAAFRDHALGRAIAPQVLGIHVEGGGFHIKTAGLLGERPVFAAKVNGNFGDNEARFGLPRIQGIIVLCDARRGSPLAVMDSSEITALRTAAATAVAARHLARPGATSVLIAGCGRQSRSQLAAVAAVRPITCALAVDKDPLRARAFAREMTAALGFPVAAAPELAPAARQCGIVVTCTSAQGIVLQDGDVAPGTFVAAVGADSESKQEIAPALMARAAVVPDLLEQAAAIGDLHHAILAGAMRREDVRAELGAVVAGCAKGRLDEEEVVIFDSTGTALQDVAAAALVYDRAVRLGAGLTLDFQDGARWNAAQVPAFRVTM